MLFATTARPSRQKSLAAAALMSRAIESSTEFAAAMSRVNLSGTNHSFPVIIFHFSADQNAL
jgi:hypothetical protein